MLPPWGNQVLLVARDSGVDAVDALTGQSLALSPTDIGRFAGSLNRVRVSGTDNLGSTVTLGSGIGVTDLRISDEGILRDGFGESGL